jgi:hypothetical protein
MLIAVRASRTEIMVSTDDRLTESSDKSSQTVRGTSELAIALRFFVPFWKRRSMGEAFAAPWIILSSSVGSLSI